MERGSAADNELTMMKLIVLSVCALVAADAVAQAAPDYARFDRGIYLPFQNGDGGLRGRTPSLGLSFGGRTMRATMDTGSTGVVVAASAIPDFAALRSTGDGKLTYTSSGRVMVGRWVMTPMTIVGADGAEARIDEIPVLAVTRVECLRQARNCKPSSAPRGIAMIGIGFAREANAQAQSTPDKNPFLHLAGRGDYRPGYVVTDRGVHVGLTGANTRGDFRYRKLDRDDAHGDWQPMPMCIRVDRRDPPACGTLLVDTGVSTSYMTLPAEQVAQGAHALPPGSEVAVSLGTGDSAQALYEFRIDDPRSAMAPRGVTLRVAPPPAFLNTSVYFLNGFDYLYDFAGGYVGFKRR
jgi:hypothetical protein